VHLELFNLSKIEVHESRLFFKQFFIRKKRLVFGDCILVGLLILEPNEDLESSHVVEAESIEELLNLSVRQVFVEFGFKSTPIALFFVRSQVH
jgi:UDP-3-O-acyl-N-acetylglucosamine deacetylase